MLTCSSLRSPALGVFQTSKPSLRRSVGHNNLAVRPMILASSNKQPEQNESRNFEKLALPAAAFLGAALLFAATPDDALAARSGGRVGGSSFSSRPRSAPSAPRSGGSSRTYNYYSAPPIVSPYGYGFGMPFFGGGVGFFPMFGIGSLFNILLIMVVLNVVLNTVRNFTNKNDSGSWKDRDDDDERW